MNTEKKFSILNFQFSVRGLFLVMILVIAAVLRLWQLGEYPIHLTNDEAAVGYNAYSILQTARDEHGEFLPIVFKSFGDWKPGLYIYATAPSVFLFGLSEFATRLPSALFGILAVYMVYLLVRRLFDERVAIFSAMSLAIMPWHIHFSRGGWEANLATTLLLVAVWFFVKSFEKQKYIIFSAICFALTLWTYQSAKLASLLVVLALIAVYRQELFGISKKYLGTAFVAGVILSVPIVLSMFSGKGGRIEVMSLFSYERPEEYIQQTILKHEEISRESLVFTLFHSENLNFARGIAGRYFNYFSGRFLFFEGDWSSLRHSSPNVGYLLFAQVPIFVYGLFVLFKKKDKQSAFLLLWLVLSPIPAAITRDSVHGVRALNLTIPLSVVLGFGLYSIVRLTKPVFWVFLFGVYLYSLVLYLDSYLVHNKFVNAENYFYGYRETVGKIDEIANDKNVVFDQSYDQPYIFFLFYQGYDPATFQRNRGFIKGIAGDVGFVGDLDNIEFRPINWSSDKMLTNSLIVGKPASFPLEEVRDAQEYNVEAIKYPNGHDAFLIVEPR
jgi:4-amino-4-deoxy-L-arabinose transferase-like glycosyltransferase